MCIEMKPQEGSYECVSINISLVYFLRLVEFFFFYNSLALCRIYLNEYYNSMYLQTAADIFRIYLN